MEREKQNKMAVVLMTKLIWKMGLPMIISMILQSVYNIVDTAFIINMGEDGVAGNLALTYAFPIQILIIAVGVGTGVGINALLSKKLGEGDKKGASMVAGNGIFLGICIYAVFLLFGLFGSKWFISMQAGSDEKVIEMGTEYLTICCTLSIGSIGYSIVERFLQATGKTLYSTISQISGALANIVLDYIFIYPCKMGIAGAAWATIIGQILSVVVALLFHFLANKEIKNGIRYLKPNGGVIKGIYQIGISAALMQGLLSVMMLGMNLILGFASVNATLLQGSFGIYYKIMQFALFAAFGVSNTIISVLSFNYGMKDKLRSKECIKWGIIDSVLVALIITVLFECLAVPLAQLFGIASGESGGEIQQVVVYAIRISSISYVFMGLSVAIQGVLQAFRYALMPFIISLLRLCVLVLPIAFLFTLSSDAIHILWWTFPIVEVLTAAVSVVFLKLSEKKKFSKLKEIGEFAGDNVFVTIAREHGSNGKYVGKLVAEKLGLKFFDKEVIADVAHKTGLDKAYIDNIADAYKSFYPLYLSTKTNQTAIIAQADAIRKIAESEGGVFVGRGADHVLEGNKNLFKVFIYASDEFKINNIMNYYGDTRELAAKNMKNSNQARAVYYNFISGKTWGDKANYDLVIDSSVGEENAAEKIAEFVRAKIAENQAKGLEKNLQADESAQVVNA